MKLVPKLLALATVAALSSPACAEITIDVIGGSEVSFEGLIQADANWYDNDVLDLNGAGSGDGKNSEFNTRRSEIVLKGKGPGMWSWVAGYDTFASKFLDVNVAYKFNADTVLTLGQFKQPNSLEELSSTKNNDFISKAMTTNLSGMSRRLGAQLATGGSKWGVMGSLFTDELTRNQGGSLGNGDGFGLRGYFTPIKEDGNFVHLGASYINKQVQDATANDRLRLRVRPDADLTTARLLDAGQFTDADDLQVVGLEGAWVHGPVKLQAEWMNTSVDRKTHANFSADSWYVYGVYNLTGETWGYKNGVITTSLPNEPVSGMWQLGVRYDDADLYDGGINGGSESNWTLGVNWYLRSNFKISANYVMVNSERGALRTSDDPNILETRLQFYW